MDFWVDLAEIVGALATSVALFFVARATLHSKQTVREAQRMRDLEGGRDERAIAAEERRQAARVAFWPVRGEVEGIPQWGIELVNSSDAPVFALDLHREAGKSGNGSAIPEIRAMAKILPPGRYFFSERKRWPVHVERHLVLEPIPGNTDYMPSVRFIDSDGRSWARKEDGRLEPATTNDNS
ncbi:hypothetical protein ACIQC5_05440 [Paenarthrobacter sp. NPDC092416]|uniref:hypothetical protein n=1 Tax=Paenarthrobacter sp. NPDC092416 TaxID=3364386 RepID=UPI00380592F9